MRRFLWALLLLSTPAFGQSVFNCSSFTTTATSCGVGGLISGSGSAFKVVGTQNGTTPAVSGGNVTLLTTGSNHAALSFNYQTQVNVQAFTSTFQFVPNGQNIVFMVQNSNNNPTFNTHDFSAGAGCEADFFQAFSQPSPPNNVFALELDSYSGLTAPNSSFTYSSAQTYSSGTSPCIPNDSGNTYPQINKLSKIGRAHV